MILIASPGATLHGLQDNYSQLSTISTLSYCPMTTVQPLSYCPMTTGTKLSYQTWSCLLDEQAPHSERREEEPHTQALHGPVCQHGPLHSGGQHVHPCPVQAPAGHRPRHTHLPGSIPTTMY